MPNETVHKVATGIASALATAALLGIAKLWSDVNTLIRDDPIPRKEAELNYQNFALDREQLRTLSKTQQIKIEMLEERIRQLELEVTQYGR